MASKTPIKAFSKDGDDVLDGPLSGVASLALQKVAADRHSAPGKGATTDLFPFFKLLVGGRTYDGPDHVIATLTEARVSADIALDTLIPDLAALIGDQWLSDDMSWSTVTIISARLQTLAWRYIEPIMAEMSAFSDAPTVLMVVPEGETHTLAGVLAIGVLVREGINATGVFGEPDERVFDIVRAGAFDAIGVSTSGVGGKDRLAPLIKALHTCSDDAILSIGGSISTCNPQLLRELRGISHKVRSECLITLLQSGLTQGRTSAQTGSRAAVSDLSAV